MQEAARREKRRLLDAQRGKCRVRLGCHLEEWCALKDHLGFSLHSQFAKFLLDSYRATKDPGISAPKADNYLSVSPASLHHLAILCNQHGKNCNSPLTILSPSHGEKTSERPVLLWGCKQDHHFDWDPHDHAPEIRANLEGINGKFQESQFTELNKTKDNENVPEKNTKETRKQGMVMSKHKEILQVANIVPEDIVFKEKLCERQTESDGCENNNTKAGLSSDVDKTPDNIITNKELTENRAEKIQKKTSENEYDHLITNIFERREENITDNELLCHNARGEKILHMVLENKDSVNGPGPQTVVFAENTQESTSIDLIRKKSDLPIYSDNTSKHQRDNLQVSEPYIQVITAEQKSGLSLPCKRSSHGSKFYNMKAQFKDVCSDADETHGCDFDKPLSMDKGTETPTEICLAEESITGEDAEQITLSEDLQCFADAGEQKKSSPGESGNMSKGEPGQNSGAASELEKSVETQEQQDSQPGSYRASRRKPYIDEELAQICKKRIRKATPPELLMCEYDDCGKIFSKRQYLNYHQKYQHMNQRMFRCSVSECGKTFNFKKHLKEHEKRHSDRRDFICEFCARAFRSSSNLIIHRRIHTGEKPLQCEFCGFTCRQKASLNWHMKKHNADSLYKFPCDICGQRFEKRDNLAAHMSRKHPAPQSTVATNSAHCNAPSIVNISETEPSCKAECTEILEMVQTSQETVKETLYSNYLDLSESMHRAAPQTVQASENTEISLVIVL